MKTCRFASILLSCLALLCHNASGDSNNLSSLGQIKGYGSAFFVSPDGHLLTAYHVVGGTGHVAIAYQGQYYPAEILGFDQNNDLALLKIPAINTPYLSLCQPRDVRVGQDVLATGFPNPSVQGNDVKLTDGMVSCLSGVQGSKNQIQTSAPIQPGNSGGPLTNRRTGDVIGVIVSTLKHRPDSSTIPQCVNYAIKIQLATPLLVPHINPELPKREGQPIDQVLNGTVQVLKTERRAEIDVEGQLSDFIKTYFSGNHHSSMFNSKLEMFFKNIDVPREQVIASLEQHKRDWPSRSFEIEQYQIQNLPRGLFGMSVNYTYNLRNGARKNTGQASALFKIRQCEDQFKIYSIQETNRNADLFSNGQQNQAPDGVLRKKREWSPYTYTKY